MADARLEPQNVDGIEMHGTGTALGDPIEVGALQAVFEGTLHFLSSISMTVWKGTTQNSSRPG